MIQGNTVNVLHAQASGANEFVAGIWENFDGTGSNITVSDNHFVNQAAGNDPTHNQQVAFILTSPSSRDIHGAIRQQHGRRALILDSNIIQDTTMPARRPWSSAAMC